MREVKTISGQFEIYIDERKKNVSEHRSNIMAISRKLLPIKLNTWFHFVFSHWNWMFTITHIFHELLCLYFSWLLKGNHFPTDGLIRYIHIFFLSRHNHYLQTFYELKCEMPQERKRRKKTYYKQWYEFKMLRQNKRATWKMKSCLNGFTLSIFCQFTFLDHRK